MPNLRFLSFSRSICLNTLDSPNVRGYWAPCLWTPRTHKPGQGPVQHWAACPSQEGFPNLLLNAKPEHGEPSPAVAMANGEKVCLLAKYGREGRSNYLSPSFVEKRLTGTEDHPNKSPASVKEISRWQSPAPHPNTHTHIATAPFCSPSLLTQHLHTHYVICASQLHQEAAGLVLLLFPFCR